MFILLDTNNNVCCFNGTSIEYGVFDEPIEKWKVTNEICTFYVVGDCLECIEVESLPSDYIDGRYLYTEEKGFYKNDNYIEPINTEDEMKRLMQENIELKEQLDMVQEVLDFLTMT